MEQLEFTVPMVVPSGNHYKRPCRYIGKDGGLHLGFKVTKEAQAYYDAVAIFARGESVADEDARYSVFIDVYLGRGQRGDFDNFWKCGLDALVKAGVIHSDAAVDGLESRCVVHKDQRDNPRTEYQVRRINAQS